MEHCQCCGYKRSYMNVNQECGKCKQSYLESSKKSEISYIHKTVPLFEYELLFEKNKACLKLLDELINEIKKRDEVIITLRKMMFENINN